MTSKTSSSEARGGSPLTRATSPDDDQLLSPYEVARRGRAKFARRWAAAHPAPKAFSKAVHKLAAPPKVHAAPIKGECPEVQPGAELPRPAGTPSWVEPMDARSYAIKSHIRQMAGLPAFDEALWRRTHGVLGKFRVVCEERIAKDRAFVLGDRCLADDIKELELEKNLANCKKPAKGKENPVGLTPEFNYQQYKMPDKLGLRMVKCSPKQKLTLQPSKHYKEAKIVADEANLDPSCFGDSMTIDRYDPLKAKYPEKKPPVLELWQYNAFEETLPTDAAQEAGASGKTEDLGVIGANGKFLPAPLDWEDRHIDELRIVRPRLKEHLDARGSTMHLSETKIPAFNRWLNNVVDMAMYNPCLVDHTTEAFKSGAVPTTGLSEPYFSFPDCEYFGPPNHEPNFGELKWDFSERGPDPKEIDPDLVKEAEMTIADTMDAFMSILADQNKMEKQAVIEAQKKMEESAAREKEYQLAHEPYKQPDPFKANDFNNNPISPDIWMYVRPARKDDYRQMRDIYNYYTTQTVHAQHQDPVDEHYFESVCGAANKRGLPVLVACAYNNRSKGRRKINGPVVHRERILGFCFASQYRPEETFKATYEAFVFTSPDHSAQRKGVGKNLLDRLLTALDKGYEPFWATDLHPDGRPLMDFVPGGKCNLHGCRKIIASVYYENRNGKELLWKRRFLGRFGFSMCGVFYNVANKTKYEEGTRVEQPYNMASFIYETGDTGVTDESVWYRGCSKNKPVDFHLGDLL